MDWYKRAAVSVEFSDFKANMMTDKKVSWYSSYKNVVCLVALELGEGDKNEISVVIERTGRALDNLERPRISIQWPEIGSFDGTLTINDKFYTYESPVEKPNMNFSTIAENLRIVVYEDVAPDALPAVELRTKRKRWK